MMPCMIRHQTPILEKMGVGSVRHHMWDLDVRIGSVVPNMVGGAVGVYCPY